MEMMVDHIKALHDRQHLSITDITPDFLFSTVSKNSNFGDMESFNSLIGDGRRTDSIIERRARAETPGRPGGLPLWGFCSITSPCCGFCDFHDRVHTYGYLASTRLDVLLAELFTYTAPRLHSRTGYYIHTVYSV